MRDIGTKSTGQLFDELVTNAFKIAFAVGNGRDTVEFGDRRRLLRTAIDDRMGAMVTNVVNSACVTLFSTPQQPWQDKILHLKIDRRLRVALLNLCECSIATWRHQETIMGDAEDATIAHAARAAQQCNARRAEAIRQIDRLLGESDVTITSKTYG